MINEERVKKLYKVALYEQNAEKQYTDTGCYYKSDYIGKEMLKSLFSGTIAYVILAVLWALGSMEQIEEMLVNMKIFDTLLTIGLMYIGFIATYLFATFLIYRIRYMNGRKKLNLHMENLKKVKKMYERDDKLKI
ncbi:MAG: hypothetical protein IKJ01_10425 [Lachnospiraceae bacterium]|nr:hypothetical protein [Lachnospiraceae bacterium]